MRTREELKLRVYGTLDRPTLIYLPGLHGDWTLIGGFRRALGGRVRFVEVTYPRTLTWTLDDYAAAIEAVLKNHGIKRGWLLGESFGSQIVWPLIARARFKTDGAVLAGGFVRHPTPRTARLLGLVTAGLPFPVLRSTLKPYARVMKWRYRRSPEVLQNVDRFLVRRTDLDRKAAAHRLRLLAENDPSQAAQRARPPVFALTGLWDAIVPWFPVRRWLRIQCPSLRDHKIIWRADHQVLATAPEKAARVILDWIAGIPSTSRCQQPKSRTRTRGMETEG
jgi:pimeloyl-ACP methyl ester carboxylesterase